MKLYKKLKGMGKTAKIALVGASIYTAISLSACTETKKEPFQFTNVDNIVSVEQVKDLYTQKTAEYATDKKFSHDEIRDLHYIMDKGHFLEKNTNNEAVDKLKGRYDSLLKDAQPLKEEKKSLQNEITSWLDTLKSEKSELSYLDYLIKEDAKKQKMFLNHKKDVQDICDTFDNLFKTYYPGLIDDNPKYKHISYTSSDIVPKTLVSIIEPLMRKADDIFVEVYGINDTYFLKENLTIHDLLVFREFISQPREPKDDFSEKGYVKKKNEKMELIAGLEKKLVIAEKENNPKTKEIDAKLLALNVEIGHAQNDYYAALEEMHKQRFFNNGVREFSSYVDALKSREDWIKNNKIDFSKYWASSLMINDGFKGHLNDSYYNFTKEIKNLENILKNEVEGLPNPTKPEYPLVVTWLGGFFFTLIRRYLIGAHIVNRDLYVGDVIDTCAVSGLLGPIFLDGLHPLVFPARMILTPFVEEPIAKMCGWTKPLK